MWPFKKEPKPEEINAAVERAARDMKPNPLAAIADIEPGHFIFGSLLCVSNSGLFVNPADIVLINLHPRSPEIMLRNGETYKLSRYGANQVAKTIAQQMKGRGI